MDKYISFLYDNVLAQKLRANCFMDMAACSQETISKIHCWWLKCTEGFSNQCNLYMGTSGQCIFTYVMSCKYADTLFEEHAAQIHQLSLENQELKKLVQQLLDERKAPAAVNATQPRKEVSSPISDVDDEDVVEVVNEPLLAAERRYRKNNPVSKAVDKFKKSYYSVREEVRQEGIARDWMA